MNVGFRIGERASNPGIRLGCKVPIVLRKSAQASSARRSRNKVAGAADKIERSCRVLNQNCAGAQDYCVAATLHKFFNSTCHELP